MPNILDNLAAHISQIEGERNPFTAPRKHEEVRDYLEQAMGAHSDWSFSRHPFNWQGVEGLNLVLKVSGREDGPHALIGAHYDSVPGSPGADDNASGVAALLELARSLEEHPPRRPLWLVAFDLEEWGMRGSRALARELKRDGQKPAWMASLEMLGYRRHEAKTQSYPFPFGWFYPDRGDFVLMLGNIRAHGLMGRMAGAFDEADVRTERLTLPFNGWVVPRSRWSDQSPFWDIGVPGVMLTDTAWLRNPNYHMSTDRAETLDLEFTADVVRVLGAFLRD